MLEDEDGMSERGLSTSRRRYDDEEGERNLGGMPQTAAGSSLPADASDLPALGSPHPMHDVGKAPVDVLSPVGRWQISPWLFGFFLPFLGVCKWETPKSAL